jgi:hypothetical protein
VTHHLRQMLGIFFALVAVSLYAASRPQECTHGCLVRIEGVQGEYSPESHTNVSIFNESRNDLDVNVALEGLEDGSWVEIAGSVTNPGQSFSKMLKLTPIKAGSSLVLAFNPCEIPILVMTGGSLGKSDHPCLRPTEAGAPTSLRLRVDAYRRRQGEVIQQVRSGAFHLLTGN